MSTNNVEPTDGRASMELYPPPAGLNALSSVYTPSWFSHRAGYRAAYHRFARAIEEMWHPRSLLDLGCGAGWILEHFAGRIPALGVDGSQAALDAQAPAVRKLCVLRDLTGSPGLYAALTWDQAVSIEVAEHIPAEHADDFLRWFDGAERVLLTAAPPGQGGTHHVNEQPQSYWIEKMEARNLRFSLAETETWKALARHYTKGCPWVVRNAMIFIRVYVAQPPSAVDALSKEGAG